MSPKRRCQSCGRRATAGLSAYQAAKWAVGGFSEVLAPEVGPLGIRVTVLEPGGMQTDWAGSSMQVPPISEPYLGTVGVMARMHYELGSAGALGDPAKVAQVVLSVAAMAELGGTRSRRQTADRSGGRQLEWRSRLAANQEGSSGRCYPGRPGTPRSRRSPEAGRRCGGSAPRRGLVPHTGYRLARARWRSRARRGRRHRRRPARRPRAADAPASSG